MLKLCVNEWAKIWMNENRVHNYRMSRQSIFFSRTWRWSGDMHVGKNTDEVIIKNENLMICSERM